MANFDLLNFQYNIYDTNSIGDFALRDTIVYDKVYYASANGSNSNNGTTSISAVASLNKVIQLATSAGYTTDQTVVAYIDGIVPWGGTVSSGLETLTSHNFKLVVIGLTGQSDTLGDGQNHVRLGGPIVFNDIKLNMGNTYKYLALNGNSAFLEGVVFADRQFDISLAGGNVGGTYSKPIQIDFNVPIVKIFAGSIYNTTTYNERINVNFNAGEGEVIIQCGSNNGKTIFNKGVNLTFSSNLAPTFTKTDSMTIGTNGYLQIVNNNPDVELPRTYDLDRLWVINNKVPGIVYPTNAAGVFSVMPGYKGIATDINGNTTTSSGLLLSLPAEQYAVTAEMEEETGIIHTGTYYVPQCYSTVAQALFTVDAPKNSSAKSLQVNLQLQTSEGWITLSTKTINQVSSVYDQLSLSLGDMIAEDDIDPLLEHIVQGNKLFFTLQIVERSSTNGGGTVLNSYYTNEIEVQVLDKIMYYINAETTSNGIMRVYDGEQWNFSKIQQQY